LSPALHPLPHHLPHISLLDRLGRSLTLRLFWFSLFSLIALWVALGNSASLNLFQDAQFLMGYEEHAVRTVRDHWQMPLWDPWSCGGQYSLGNPQTRMTSPFFLLSLILGAPRAAPFIVFICMVLGAEGFFRYARLRTPAPGLIALVAPAFVLNGFLSTCYALGWIHFFGFAFLPWVLYGVHLAMRGHLRGHVIAGITIGVTIGFGGNYATVFAFFFGAIEALFALPRGPDARSRAAWGRFLARGAALGVILLACTAYRTYPVLTELARSPRVMAGSPSHSLGFLGEMSFVFPNTQPVTDLPGRYYMGLAILSVLAIIGLFRRRMWSRGFLVVGIVLAATGYHFGTGPFVWLRELPIFNVLRYPERFLYVAALFYHELVISGFLVLTRLARRIPKPRLALAVVPAIVLITLTSHAFQTVSFVRMTAGISTTPLPAEIERPFALARGNRWVMSLFAYESRGSISCGEAYPVVMSPLLRGDLPSEVYLANPEAGSAERTHWSPNKLGIHVELKEPTRLLVNQNYHPGWHSDIGEVVSNQRLLAVDLPAGAHDLTLSFLPKTAVVGLATSLATVLGFCLIGLYRRRTGSNPRELPALAVLAVIPLFGGAAGWVMAPHEAREAPIVFNPDGTDLLVDAVPPEATPVNAVFGDTVELVASRFGTPDAEGNLPGELWFRITGPVPRAIGVFVHVFDGDRRIAQGDREVIGGTYFFANAPKDQLIRHAFAIKTGPAPTPMTWRVDAGLYQVYGDQSRVPVTQVPDARRGPDNRVIVRP